MRDFAGGLLASLLNGRRGRTSSSPPQLGHLPPRTLSAQMLQNVHSNEQIRASLESGGRSLSQHSQPGRSSSIEVSRLLGLPYQTDAEWQRINVSVIIVIRLLGIALRNLRIDILKRL